MRITIKLFATFRIGRFPEDQRNYPQGTTCEQVAEDLGAEKQEIGPCFVNGRLAWDMSDIVKKKGQLGKLAF